MGHQGLAKSVAEWKEGGVPVNYYKVQIEGVENERYASRSPQPLPIPISFSLPLSL